MLPHDPHGCARWRGHASNGMSNDFAHRRPRISTTTIANAATSGNPASSLFDDQPLSIITNGLARDV